MKSHSVSHSQLAVRRPKSIASVAVAIFKDELRGDRDAAYDLDRSRRIRLHVVEHFHVVFEDHVDLAGVEAGKLSRILLEGRHFNSDRPKIFVGRRSGDRPDLLTLEVVERFDAFGVALSRRQRGAVPPGWTGERYDLQAIRRLVDIRSDDVDALR